MNLVISSQEPVVVGEHFWSQDEIDAGWEVFKAAQFIWAQEKGYTPGIIESPGSLSDSSESPSIERSLPTDAETCR